MPLVSSLFGAALVAGNTIASGTSVPLAGVLGGWAPALGSWALLALLGLGASLTLRPARRVPGGQPRRFPTRRLLTSRLAWAMVLLFGCQSATAYAQFGWLPTIFRDGGLSATQAGWMLAIVTGVSLPLTLLLPLLMRVAGHTPWLPIGFALLTISGWLGVLLAPGTAPWLWAGLLGAGSTVFTWVLALLGQKSQTLAGTAALSGFVQSLGYLLAAAGPFGAGWLHDLAGSWTPTLIGLVLLAALTGVVGVSVNRPHLLEDDLHLRREQHLPPLRVVAEPPSHETVTRGAPDSLDPGALGPCCCELGGSARRRGRLGPDGAPGGVGRWSDRPDRARCVDLAALAGLGWAL